MKMFAVAIILGFASLIGKICLILVGNGGGITKTRLFKYSCLPLSRTRLSRITAYLEVKIWPLPKHENLTTGKKYCGK